ncbi:hypothetical protein [Alkalihalophilus marmarensis]|uniref:hypothetical protein n=1 Tax=Alkalihalophilus marmarensis TaxID=521377 RepID=UPI002DBA9835|nr:hypothetical protein [Alkalihalophilus marmarensis]MEC2070346.1 hypothetical protein [Alkalihalophilus marmarensis]
MAERFIFFNSAPGDPRIYQASDFAEYFGDVLSTGLLHTDENPALEVKVEGGTLRTYVEPGKALMKGYAYENTSPLYLEHALPEATLDRIDRIVLRLDKRNQSRFIKLFVKQGESGENPAPPSLQQDDFIYELSLAQITVRANTASLDPFDLTDERLNESLCGLVHSLISIPTSQFQEQWDLYFNSKKDELDAETLAYQQNIADKLIQAQTDLEQYQSGLSSKTAQFEDEFYIWFNDLQETGYASYTDLTNLQEEVAAHKADDEQHLLVGERDTWNGKADLDETGNVPETQLGNAKAKDGIINGETTDLTYFIMMGAV